MGPDGVVVVTPSGERPPSVSEASEHLFVQQLIAQATVEAFDEGVLLGLPRLDIAPVDAGLALPSEDRLRGELGPIVADDLPGLAVEPDQPVQLARH